MRSRHRRQMGPYGWSLISQPAIAGTCGSRKLMSERMIRLFACPPSPRQIPSWPEMPALASCGSPVSSYPTMPGSSGSPLRSRASRLRRISCLTFSRMCPDERSSPMVRAAAVIHQHYRQAGRQKNGARAVRLSGALTESIRDRYEAAHDEGQPLLGGHRGNPAHNPENTIRSFRSAITAGCDLIECDVHLSLDGRLMVIHDHTLERTTTGTGLVRDKPRARRRRRGAVRS